MAIPNKWKEVIASTDVSQNAVADALGINRGMFSRVCNGMAILEEAELPSFDAIMQREYGIRVSDAYDPAIYEVLYGDKFRRSSSEARKPSVQVRILGDIAATLDRMVQRGDYDSRNKAVNTILRRALVHETSL